MKHIKQTGNADVTDAAILSETPRTAPTENLADLAAEAAALEAEPTPIEAKQQAEAEQQRSDTSRAAVEVIYAGLAMARRLAQPKFEWWRDFGAVWSDDTLKAQAEALDEFGTAMGWDATELLDKFGPYFKLAMAFGVPCFVTWQAVKQLREIQRQQQQKPAAGDGGQQ